MTARAADKVFKNAGKWYLTYSQDKNTGKLFFIYLKDKKLVNDTLFICKTHFLKVK